MSSDITAIVREKISQARRYMRDEGIDLWIVYASDHSDPVLPLIPGVGTVGPGAFLFGSEGTSVAVCSSIDAQDVVGTGLFDRVLEYGATAGISERLQEAVTSMPHGRIALNYSMEAHLCDGLTEGRYRSLMRIFTDLEGEAEFVSSDSFLTRVRSIKSPGEVDAIRRAIDTTQDIYAEVFGKLQVGQSEREIGAFFVEGMRSRNVVNGMDRQLSMPIVMKERFAHRGPGEARMEEGDLLIMDFSVDVDGYVSDIARTVYFLRKGETAAPPDVQNAFNAVHGAVSVALDTIKPGVPGHEVDAAARAFLIEKGYPEITHATGHQVGRATHDGGVLLGPKWERYGSAPLGKIEEGMVFTVEPTIVSEGEPSFIVEDICVVGKDGPELISTRQDELILIG
jgi:Xaa-Pro aminopeptidase